MSTWTPNELAMVEAALRANLTPAACKGWFPDRSRQAIRACFERVRIRLCIRGTRGRPPSIERAEAGAIDITYTDRVFETNARDGSHKLLHRQLQTGQYFGQARAQWLERHAAVTQTIVLPWPPRTLSPNGRAHWSVKAKAAKIAKDYAFWATKEARIGIAAGDVPIMVSLVFHPKTKNLPDEDNAVASMKASLDGIAKALGVDDSVFRLAKPVIADPVKGGRVVVTLA